MAHQYNRIAFQGGMAGPHPLLGLYCSLIDLELAIKNHFFAVSWRSGHRIIDWVVELGEPALAVQLRDNLALLQCTGRNGNVAPLDGNSYPEVRYLRHASDFAGMSTDAQINAARQIVTDIRDALKARGVNV